jgi:hypothetical protein
VKNLNPFLLLADQLGLISVEKIANMPNGEKIIKVTLLERRRDEKGESSNSER